MIQLSTSSKVLVLAPHTDDGELGLGGTIASLIEKGITVYYAVFCNASESLPEDTLKKELDKATTSLGITGVFLYDFVVRRFHKRRQEILEILVDLRKTLQPDLVFAPSSFDVHQDHAIICNEAIRAFNGTTLLGYELPWNNRFFSYDCFFSLQRKHIDSKIQALSCYESQKHRKYVKKEYVVSLARTNGLRAKTEFAESFEVLRLIFK